MNTDFAALSLVLVIQNIYCFLLSPEFLNLSIGKYAYTNNDKIIKFQFSEIINRIIICIVISGLKAVSRFPDCNVN